MVDLIEFEQREAILRHHGLNEAASNASWDELLMLRQEYVKVLEVIRQRVQRTITLAGVAKIIGSATCDGCAWSRLHEGEQRRIFDNHWRGLHDEVKRRFIEVTVERLNAIGRTVQVYSELPSIAGRFDVVIVGCGHGPLTLHLPAMPPPFQDILVEIKVGKSWSLEQVERYLALNNARALILLRLITSDAVKFKIEEMLRFLIESLKAKVAKCRRIIDEQFMLVPDWECYVCNRDCKFIKRRGENNVVLLSHEDFQMMPKVIGNMYVCIDKAVKLVVEELS